MENLGPTIHKGLRSQGSLSYFLQKLTSLGFDAKQFGGLHSLRSGGATAAAQVGVPDYLNDMVVGVQKQQMSKTLCLL